MSIAAYSCNMTRVSNFLSYIFYKKNHPNYQYQTNYMKCTSEQYVFSRKLYENYLPIVMDY